MFVVVFEMYMYACVDVLAPPTPPQTRTQIGGAILRTITQIIPTVQHTYSTIKLTDRSAAPTGWPSSWRRPSSVRRSTWGSRWMRGSPTPVGGWVECGLMYTRPRASREIYQTNTLTCPQSSTQPDQIDPPTHYNHPQTQHIFHTIEDTFTFFYGERMPLWIRVRAQGNTGHGSRCVYLHKTSARDSSSRCIYRMHQSAVGRRH